MGEQQLSRRMKIYCIFICILLTVLAGRLWHLQVLRGEYYQSEARGNRIRTLRQFPARGIITDAEGQVLAGSRSSFTISVVPNGLGEDQFQVFEKLSLILDIPLESLEQAARLGRGMPYEPIRLLRDVDIATVVAVEENRIHLPGVLIEREPVREYSEWANYAAHVVGHLGAISQEELVRYGREYRPTDLVGKLGLELLHEELLRGIPGSLTVEVNALNRAIQVLSETVPVPGHNIQLTINSALQQVAYEAFNSHTDSLREQHPHAQNGAVVAMDPNSGRILAMVSVPSFSPGLISVVSNHFVGLLTDPRLPLFNRVVQGQYGPGSAFKPFTAVAVLEEGVFAADDLFVATGRSRHGVRDWVITRGLPPFGEITMQEAIAMSSNHFFADMGAAVGIDRLSVWARDFGFGTPLGLDIRPREASGLVPDREWKRAFFAAGPSYDRVWYPSDTEQISIGQGFLTVTPLQLATAYSMLATRGQLYQPFLVEMITDAEGKVVHRQEPLLTSQLDIGSEIWDTVHEGMVGTIEHPRGTARHAFATAPYSLAGKTGSYEIPGRDSHAVFAAYAPANNPEIVVVVVVEHGGGGGSGAAPIARRVFDAYFGVESQGMEQETGSN